MQFSMGRLLLASVAAAALGVALSTANAEDNTVTLCDQGIRNIPSRLVVGWTGTNNALIVRGGASILSMTGEIGLAGSYNRALVSGPGSLWSNQCPFKVGTAGGWNQLLVADGGCLVNRTMAVIGDNNGIPGNSVVITDPGSTWHNDGGLTVGWGGQLSSLAVSNDAHVFNTHAVIGRDTAAISNTVAVSGRGSLWENDGVLIVGVFGAGNRLRIAEEGVVTATSLSVYWPGNSIEISGGYLFLTNRPQAAVFDPTLSSVPWREIAWSNSFRLEDCSSLAFQLNSSQAGNARPFILVDGPVTFTGDLSVRLAPASQPPRDAIFTLMKYSSANGAFRNVSSGGRIATSDQIGSFRVVITDSFLQLTDFEPTLAFSAVFSNSPAHEAVSSVKVGATAQPASIAGMGDRLLAAPERLPAFPKLRCVVRDGVLGLEFPWTPNRIHRLWVSTNLQTWTEVAAPVFEFPAPDIARWRAQPPPDAEGGGKAHVFRLAVE